MDPDGSRRVGVPQLTDPLVYRTTDHSPLGFRMDALDPSTCSLGSGDQVEDHVVRHAGGVFEVRSGPNSVGGWPRLA